MSLLASFLLITVPNLPKRVLIVYVKVTSKVCQVAEGEICYHVTWGMD